MMSPQELQERQFSKAVFGGYDMGQVDVFKDEIADDYEALYKENAILKGKLKVLIEKVEEYRSTEDAMRMALLTAKKMGEDMLSEARKNRDEMLRAAEEEGAAKKAEIQQGIADEEKRLQAAQRVTADFVDLSTNLVRQHMQFLQNLGSIKAGPEPEKPIRKFEVAPKKAESADAAAKDIEASVSKLFEDGTPAQDADALRFGGNNRKAE